MDPWQSWAIVLLSGGAAWWYYNSQAKRKTKTTRTPTFSAQGQSKSQKRRDEGKARRRKDGGLENGEPSPSDRPIQSLVASPRASVGGNESTKKRKGGKQTSEKAAVSSALDAPAAVKVYDDDNEVEGEGMDNREFAKQLSGLKAGTSLAPPTRTGLSKRAAKQARPNDLAQESLRPSSVSESNGVLNSQSVSTTSSTTGADADDDLSPILSPALEATSTGRTSTSGDVSDMLEAPAAGPSVLRLTNSRDSQQVKKPQQQKSSQVQETKKQRQNRQKAEEKKIAREQQEKERRVLLEKQLKTAREAEGRPARNGTAAPKPPATNAWAAQSKQTNQQAIHSSHIDSESDAPLLDTFDQGENGGRDNANGSHLAGTHSQAWERDLPSEEEQLKMIDELNDAGWNTVPKGRKAKKKPLGITGDTMGNDSSDGGLSKVNGKVNGTPKAPASQTEKSELEVGPAAGSFGGTSTPVKGNPHDSDWAVV